jgi:thiol-disulfide isomerase/thioredoxin
MNLNFKAFGFIPGLFLLVLLSITFLQNINAVETAKIKQIVLKIDKVEAASTNSAVNFTYEDNGKMSSFKELTKGKVVLLNIWGTWCGPCRMEMPDIIGIQNDLKDKKFMVVGIASEHPTNPKPYETVVTFAENQNFNYPNFIINNQLKAAYGGIPSIPTTFIIDQNGRIVEKIVGMKNKTYFMEAINRVLK